MDKTSPENKKCCKCGKPFECLHNADCWCMNYIISPENLKKIKETFSDCLCPACLSEFSTGRKKPVC